MGKKKKIHLPSATFLICSRLLCNSARRCYTLTRPCSMIQTTGLWSVLCFKYVVLIRWDCRAPDVAMSRSRHTNASCSAAQQLNDRQCAVTPTRRRLHAGITAPHGNCRRNRALTSVPLQTILAVHYPVPLPMQESQDSQPQLPCYNLIDCHQPKTLRSSEAPSLNSLKTHLGALKEGSRSPRHPLALSTRLEF